MKKAYMILDLQYGSTGKGLLAGYLAKKEAPDTIVTAWGPNAGHTYIDERGRTFIHRMLANGIVSPNLKNVLIGPGSVVDMDILLSEIRSCEDLLSGINIIIHPQAAIVDYHHVSEEAANVKIGSTMKGTGAAIIQRIRRDPDNLNNAATYWSEYREAALYLHDIGIELHCCEDTYRGAMNAAKVLQIEGAQGYSLSMYHGMYPYTTSRDVTPAQVMADCAVPWSIRPEVYGTLRTYPIRVSNRQDEEGKMIGYSGGCYRDQAEISWEQLGMEPELTTVTKLPRRIFTFSYEQLTEACRQCGPTKLFLNFANYLNRDELEEMVQTIEHKVMAPIEWIGVGPNHYDVIPAENIENILEAL